VSDFPPLLFVLLTCFWLLLAALLALAKKAQRYSLRDLLVAITIAAMLLGMGIAWF
jgi:hypothetical protein